jgi:hypothetical protein
MKQALADLFASKKFNTALIGTVVALGAHYGLKLPVELVASLVGLFAAAIVGQGLQDHGESAAIVAAKVTADKPSPVTNVVVGEVKS